MTLVHKVLTRAQLEGRREKAVRFVRDVLADPDRADEIADESLDHYAKRLKIRILGNPHGEQMSNKEELKERIRELEEENDDLQDQLDQIADIAAPIEGDEDEGDQESDHDWSRARPTVSNPPRRSLTGLRDTARARRNAGR